MGIFDVKSTGRPDLEPRVIVRVRTSYWEDKKGIHSRKSVTFLRKKCRGFNSIEEDVAVGGAYDVFSKILNIDSVEDGIYRSAVVDIQTDFETGYAYDWSYRLLPYEDE